MKLEWRQMLERETGPIDSVEGSDQDSLSCLATMERLLVYRVVGYGSDKLCRYHDNYENLLECHCLLPDPRGCCLSSLSLKKRLNSGSDLHGGVQGLTKIPRGSHNGVATCAAGRA